MNVMTKILNALAFANVNRVDELHAQLRQMDPASASRKDQTQNGSGSGMSDTPSTAPGIRHAQGAL